MALLAIPLAKVYLVEHVGGGALLHVGGGYVANTLIPATVVEAFGAASTALGTIGSASAGLATNPYVLAGAALAVVVVGTYCYFYGIPAPIEAALVKAGLATPAKQGLLIPGVKLATALVLLGLAGLVVFNFYKRVREAQSAVAAQVTIEIGGAQSTVAGTLGESAWEAYGQTLWLGLGDTGLQIKGWAESLLTTAMSASAVAGDAITKPTKLVKQHLVDAYLGATSWCKRRFT